MFICVEFLTTGSFYQLLVEIFEIYLYAEFHIPISDGSLVIAGKTNSMALEPEGSSPRSQKPATGPYPEPV
jgi:hypothetical protein